MQVIKKSIGITWRSDRISFPAKLSVTYFFVRYIISGRECSPHAQRVITVVQHVRANQFSLLSHYSCPVMLAHPSIARPEAL